jgi:hypothetical protein
MNEWPSARFQPKTGRSGLPTNSSHYKKQLSYMAAFCFIWLMSPTIILPAISFAIPRNGGLKNIPIQCQLPEKSAIFL